MATLPLYSNTGLNQKANTSSQKAQEAKASVQNDRQEEQDKTLEQLVNNVEGNNQTTATERYHVERQANALADKEYCDKVQLEDTIAMFAAHLLQTRPSDCFAELSACATDIIRQRSNMMSQSHSGLLSFLFCHLVVCVLFNDNDLLPVLHLIWQNNKWYICHP